jgi:hypothetical protein
MVEDPMIHIGQLIARVGDLEANQMRLLGIVEKQSELIERLVTITELERGV